MKIYFRVFDLKIVSSLLKFTSVYKRINKCSDTLHIYGKSMKLKEILHLSTRVKTKKSLKYEKERNMRDGER